MATKGTRNAKGGSKVAAPKKSKQSDTKMAFKVPTIPEGLSFVAYREQLLGSPGPSQPHRRMRRWWLKDSEGEEHIAVVTVKYDEDMRRFEYTASEEFANMLDMTCYSHKSVHEYLGLFLNPGSNKKVVDRAGEVSEKEKSSGDGKKRKRGGAGTSKGASKEEVEDGSTKKKAPAAAKKTSKKPRAPNSSDALLKSVSKELATLQSSYGMRYSLTIIGPHGDVKVISSPTVERIDIDPHEIEGFAYPQKLNMLSEAAHGASGDPEKSIEPNGIEDGDAERSDDVHTRSGDAVKAEGISGYDNEDIDYTEPVDGNSPAGLNALVEFIKDTEETQYLSGSFWRRDPFPSINIQNNLESMEIAPDAGQVRDIEKINHFLTIPVPRKSQKGKHGIMVLEQEPVPCDVSDFFIVPVWGIDAYTRALLDIALKSCESGIASRCDRNTFFNRFFLPQLNKLQNDGWDIFKALECISEDISVPEEYQTAAKDAQELLGMIEETSGTGVAVQRYQPLRPSGRRFCRSHPKGDGVVLRKDGGLQKDTFIGHYGGQVCMPWRFYEKDVSKMSRGNTKSQSLLSTHTATLERPNIDALGSSILYIDATQSSNFVSRIHHSCNPNCVLKTFAVGDQLKLGVWSITDIRDGEELSIDFRSKGDFERELQGLHCLCGAEYCEKSFVNIVSTTSPINTFFSEKYSILHRTKAILDSIKSGITKNDVSRLERYGFKKILLENTGESSDTTQSLPEWLKAWTSHTLKVIEEESEELKAMLHSSDKTPEDLAFGEEDIKRLSSCRVRLLMVALNKANFFLSNQEVEVSKLPPLEVLGGPDVVNHLWNGPNSIARRAVKALESYIDSLAASMGSKRSSRQQQGSETQNKVPWWQVPANDKEQSTASNGDSVVEVEYLSNEQGLEKLKELMKTEKPKSVIAAQKALRKMAEIATEGGPLHAGLHDVLLMHSYTKTFFSVTKFKPFKPYLANRKVGTRYRPTFVWALLCGWYKNAGDIVDALCNDRKGSLCLPDIECCYLPAFTNGDYMKGDERSHLVKYFEGDITSAWPRNLSSFTFKTATQYFGSPQFDAVMGGVDTGPSEELVQVAQRIQKSFSAL